MTVATEMDLKADDDWEGRDRKPTEAEVNKVDDFEKTKVEVPDTPDVSSFFRHSMSADLLQLEEAVGVHRAGLPHEHRLPRPGQHRERPPVGRHDQVQGLLSTFAK